MSVIAKARKELAQYAGIGGNGVSPEPVPPGRPSLLQRLQMRKEPPAQAPARSPLEEALKRPTSARKDRPGPLRTKDGHWVRSKSERSIADFLFDNGIRYAYETPIHLEGMDLRPDFFLPDADLFIEHFGMDTAEYKAKANEKIARFQRAGLKFIATSEDDMDDLVSTLQERLRPYLPSMNGGWGRLPR